MFRLLPVSGEEYASNVKGSEKKRREK